MLIILHAVGVGLRNQFDKVVDRLDEEAAAEILSELTGGRASRFLFDQ